MKREFLKELGLGGEQIEKIMTEYGKAVDRVKSDSENQLRLMQIDGQISASGTKAPDILKALLSDCSTDDAGSVISKLKGDYPWLFEQSLPTFSAPCNHDTDVSSPFRHGAGL